MVYWLDARQAVMLVEMLAVQLVAMRDGKLALQCVDGSVSMLVDL
jgi:hypothetical protein